MGEEGQQRPKGAGAVEKPSDELFGTFVPADSALLDGQDDELEETSQNLFADVDDEMQPHDPAAGRKKDGKPADAPAGMDAVASDKQPALRVMSEQDSSDRVAGPDDEALKKKVKLYDALFPASFEKLNAHIKSADHDYFAKSELLSSSQLQSSQAAERLAAFNAGSQKDDVAAGRQFEQTAFLTEREEERRFDAVLNKSRDLKISRGCYLIASGVDANVEEGEKELARLVRDNPELTIDQNFRDTHNRALSEMVAIRAARGLPVWNSSLQMEDIFDIALKTGPVGALDVKPGDRIEGKSAPTLLQEAADTFFDSGIDGALPIFDRAKLQAGVELDLAQRERVGLFIQSLKHDTKTALVAHNGGDIDELSGQRFNLEDLSRASYTRWQEASSRNSAAIIDCAFAKIASGKKELFVAAQDEITSYLRDNPAIGLSADFKECRRGAFKAHYENRPAESSGGEPKETSTQPVKVAYKDLQLPANFDDEDKPVKPYSVDTITSIGLFAFGVGLGLRAALQVRNRYRALAEQRESSGTEAAAEGKEGSGGTGKEARDSTKSENTSPSKSQVGGETKRAAATSGAFETADGTNSETVVESPPDVGESLEKRSASDASQSNTRFDERYNEAMKPVREAVDDAIYRLNRGGIQLYGADSPEVQNSQEVKAALKEVEPKIRQAILDFVQLSLTKQAGTFKVEVGSLDSIAQLLGSNQHRFFSLEVQAALKTLDPRVAETIKRQIKSELAAQVAAKVVEPRSREAVAIDVVEQLRSGQLRVPRLVVEQAPLVGPKGLIAPQPGVADGGNRQVRLGFCDTANASYEPSKDLISLDIYSTVPSENLMHEVGHRIRDLREQGVVNLVNESPKNRREIQRLVAEDCVREIGMGGRRCIGKDSVDRPRLYNPDASPQDRKVQAEGVRALKDMVRRYVGTSPYEHVDLSTSESVRSYYKPSEVPDSLLLTLLSDKPASSALDGKMRADGYERFVREVQLETINFMTVNSCRGCSAVTNNFASADAIAFVGEEAARIRRTSEIESATPEFRKTAAIRHAATRVQDPGVPQQVSTQTRRATPVPLDQLPEVRHMFEHTQIDALGLTSERDYPFSPWEIQQRRRQQTGQLITRALESSSSSGQAPSMVTDGMRVNARQTDILNLWNRYLDAGPESESAPQLKQQLKDAVVNPETGLLRFLRDTSTSCDAVEWLLERDIINEIDLEAARTKIAEATGNSVTSKFFDVEKPPSVSPEEITVRDYLKQIEAYEKGVSPPRKDVTDRAAADARVAADALKSRDATEGVAPETTERLSRYENGRRVAEAMMNEAFMESILREVNRPNLWGNSGIGEIERLIQTSENLETRFRTALEAKLKSLGLNLPESMEKAQIEVTTAKGNSTRGLRPDSTGTGKSDKTFFVVNDSRRASRTDNINPVAVNGGDALSSISGKTKVTPVVRIAMVFSKATMDGKDGLSRIYERYIELAQLEGRDPVRPLADLRIQQELDAADLKQFQSDRAESQPATGKSAGRRNWGRPERELPLATPEATDHAATSPFIERLTKDVAGRSPENIPLHAGRGNKRNHWESVIQDAVLARRPGLGVEQAKQIAEFIDCLHTDKVVNHDKRRLHPTIEWSNLIDVAINQIDSLDRIIRNVPTRNGEALSYEQAREIEFIMQTFDLSSPIEASRIMRIMLELENHPDAARPSKYAERQTQLSYIIYHEGLDPAQPEMVQRAEKLLTEAYSDALKPFGDFGDTNRSFKQRYDMLHVRDTLGLDSLEACKEIVKIAERFVPIVGESRSLDSYGPARQSALRAMMIAYIDPSLRVGNLQDMRKALHLYEHWDAVAATRGGSNLRTAYEGLKAAHELAELSHGQSANLDLTPREGETRRAALTKYVSQRTATENDQGTKERWSKLQTLLTTQTPASDVFVDAATTLATEARSLTMLSPAQLKALTPERYGQLLQRISEDHLLLLDHEQRAAVISTCLEPMLEQNRTATPIERAAISGAVWGVVEPLVKADTIRGDLTFDQYLRTASNNSLAALMGSASADWLGELPPADGIKIQQLLLLQAGERSSQLTDMPDLERVRFIRAWARAAELGLADNPALRAEQCEKILGNLRPGDISNLGFDLVARLITEAPFNALERMNPLDVSYLQSLLRRHLRDEAERAGEVAPLEGPIEPFVREYAEKVAGAAETKAAVEKILQRFGDAGERAQAADVLADRSQFLTARATGRQLRELADQLRSKDNFGVVQAYSDVRTGFQPAERLTVLVSSESSPGHALAVMYRNETGMSVDIKIVKSAADLPAGPAVLFDSIGEGALSEAIARRQTVAPSDGRIVVPQEVLSFERGVNFIDMAKAPLSEEHLNAVEKAIRKEMAAHESTGSMQSTSTEADHGADGQVTRVMDSIARASGNHQELLEFRGLLHFHNMRNQEMALKQAQVFAKATDFISPGEIMRLSVRLNEMLSQEIDCKKALFVVDLDREGSSHLITTMFREANPEFADSQFVTLEHVQRLASAGRLNDGGVSALIYLDDCLDSGPDSMKRVKELVSVTDLSSGQRPRVIAAMLGQFEGEVERLDGASHIAARELSSMETNIRTRLSPSESGPIPELLAAIGESQWYASKMTPLVATFYGVPNNCAKKYVQFAKNLGSAQSNKLSVDTYAKPLRLMTEQLGLSSRRVTDASIVTAMDRVLETGSLSKRESHALRMIRESLVDLTPGSKGFEHMKMLRAYLGLTSPGEQSVRSQSSSTVPERGIVDKTKPDTRRKSDSNTTIGTEVDTGAVPLVEGPLAGELVAYDDLPVSSEIKELDLELRKVLNNASRAELDKMPSTERELLYRDALDKLLPTMKKYAQTLGMSPDMVTSDSIRIALADGQGVYTLNADRITINPSSQSMVSTAMHELVHKMRWLDLVAAFQADPQGARLALLDNCLDSIGKTRRIKGGIGNEARPVFKDADTAHEFSQQVERRIRMRLSKEPPFINSDIPPEKPYSPSLLSEFGFSEMAIEMAISNECRNFGGIVDMVETTSEVIGDAASGDYVKRKSAEYKAWSEGTRGESVVKHAIRQVRVESSERQLSETEFREAVRERVALMTATESGNSATGIRVSDGFIDSVAPSAVSAPSANEARIAREYAAVFASNSTARRQFEASNRSLRDYPYLQKLLLTSSIDAVARSDGAAEYAFSSDEVAARKWEVAERARGVARELRELGEPSAMSSPGENVPTSGADRQPIGSRRESLEQSFTELTDFLIMTTRQQQLHQALLRDDISESKRLAKELVGMMTYDVTAYADHIDFLLENGLVQPNDLPASLEGFDRNGGRARAMSMSKIRLGEFSLSAAVKDTYTITGGSTEYLLREPILIGEGPTELTVRAIQVDKDGRLSVYSFDQSNTPQLDPIEHHWYGDFSKDAQDITKESPGATAQADRVSLAIDYLQNLDRQMGKDMARELRRAKASQHNQTVNVDSAIEFKPVITDVDAIKFSDSVETQGTKTGEGNGARRTRVEQPGGRPEAPVASGTTPEFTTPGAEERAAIHEGFVEQCRQSGVGDEGLAQLKRLTAGTLDKLVKLDKGVQADYIEGLRRGILRAETIELVFFEEMADRRPAVEATLHGMVKDSKLVYSSDDFAEVVFGYAQDKAPHEITLQPSLAHSESKEVTQERLDKITDNKQKAAIESWNRSENPKVRNFAKNILTLLEHNESLREFGVYVNNPNRLESRVTAVNSNLEIMLEQLKLPIAGEDSNATQQRHTRTAQDVATGERHNQIDGLQVRGRNLGDICITVRFVARDGVVTAKPMRLVDITSEMLDVKLERLNAQELDKKIALAKDKVKTAEAANDKVLAKQETERLKGMQELAILKAEYDAKVGEVSGTGDRVAMREAGVRFCEGKLHAVKAAPKSAFKEIMGKGGLITGVLLLFNAFAPELEYEPLEYERLRPGG